MAWRQSNGEPHDPTLFNANIWTLKIRNPRFRLSSPATKYSASLHIKNVGEDFPLRWKCMAEPKKCLIGERPRDGESPVATYHRLLPYYYAVVELAHRHAAPTSSIHIGEEYELYVLFTYDGSNHAFIITPLEQAQWYKEDEIFYPRQNFLIFEKGAEREITITFKGVENQNNVDISHAKLKIKFNSWNNVEIL
jgi:hypothetical protein